MPNCFQLRSKAEPTKLIRFIDLDEDLCNHFGVPVHPDEYYLGWYDFVGLRLAMGKTFDDMRQYLSTSDHTEWSMKMLAIVDYIDDHCTSDAWYEVKQA